MENKICHNKTYVKLFGDMGYINQDSIENLFVDGIHLITKFLKNMRNSLILMQDKISLRKKSFNRNRNR